MNRKSLHHLLNASLLFSLFFVVNSCGSDPSYCELPKAQAALKKALSDKMLKWQRIADFTKIEDFQMRVNRIIDEATVSEFDLEEDLGFGIVDSYKEAQKLDGGSCLCSAKFQFKTHDRYMEIFADSVNRIVEEEHRLSRAYMNVDKQINYVKNNGFVFEYLLIMNQDSTFYVPEFYPNPTADQIDNVGGLLFEYLTEHEGL